MIRVRYQMLPSGLLSVAALIGLCGISIAVLLEGWGTALLLAGLVCCCLATWWRGTQRAAQAAVALDSLARSLGLWRCAPAPVVATVSMEPPEPVFRPPALLGGALEEPIES